MMEPASASSLGLADSGLAGSSVGSAGDAKIKYCVKSVGIVITLLHRVLGLLVEEGTVRFGAALRLRLPVAGDHLPLLTTNIHVTVNTVILRTVPILQHTTVS